jgi:hypothetical protein
MKTYSQYFEERIRDNNKEKFICLKDEYPEELKGFIKQVHFESDFQGCLPNDWIYKTIYEAFVDLEQQQNIIEEVNIQADIYDYDLKLWLLNPYADEFCNYVLEEGLALKRNAESEQIMEVLQCAQWHAKDIIYHLVHRFLKIFNKGFKDE